MDPLFIVMIVFIVFCCSAGLQPVLLSITAATNSDVDAVVVIIIFYSWFVCSFIYPSINTLSLYSSLYKFFNIFIVITTATTTIAVIITTILFTYIRNVKKSKQINI